MTVIQVGRQHALTYGEDIAAVIEAALHLPPVAPLTVLLAPLLGQEVFSRARTVRSSSAAATGRLHR